VKTLLAEPEIPGDERRRRRFLHRLGNAWPTAVARLGAGWREEEDEQALAEWRQAVRDLAALLAADGERILDPPRLLSGEDVQRLLGVPPGPEVGRALDRVRRAQVDGEIATREQAERLLRVG
jgi:poly(A) polymerase